MKKLVLAGVVAATILIPTTMNAQEAECTTVDYQGAPLEMCPPQEPDPTNCYTGDYQGVPIEICMPTGWKPDPSWTYQGKPIVMHDSNQPAVDDWWATHECWIDDDPTKPIPQGEFVTYDTRLEPGAIGSHSIGGTPCGYPVAAVETATAVQTSGATPPPVQATIENTDPALWLEDFIALLG